MRAFKKYSWFGQDRFAWPIILLFLAALVPTLSLLWFMNAAMQNERLAQREKLSQAYRGHLTVSRQQLERFWSDIILQLEAICSNSAPVAFSKCVESGLIDSVVLFNDEGRLTYPNRSTTFQTFRADEMSKWSEANRLEFVQNDFKAASDRYAALSESTNVHLAARALQAQVRCLVRSTNTDTALRLISQRLRAEKFKEATDPQGRLIVANAELFALELLKDKASPLYRQIEQTLKERLLDYSNPVLAAPQRRFLMKALQGLSPDILLPTLRAEELSAQFVENRTAPAQKNVVSPTAIPGVWQFTPPDSRLVALFTPDRLMTNFQASLRESVSEVQIALVPPGLARGNDLITLPAGDLFPGWQLSLSLGDVAPIGSHRIALYLWTGIVAVALMIILALLGIQYSRRHMTLARLKTDLAATVSHELRTPLSSMRVLVDTLLDSEKIDERTTREYLQLIAQENDRLSRLIENFLCFSRLERRKWIFEFTPLPVSEITDTVALAVRNRFQSPNCRFEVKIEPDLPLVRADSHALSTALINLLDNAYKYSGDPKEILLQASANNGDVVFSVKDNGIGITPRDAKKIFRPFYQVDQRLSRQGSGFGLGLSIVQQIVAAHEGRAYVQSQPGRGSSFMIALPAYVEN